MNRSNLLRRLIGAVSVVVIMTTITFSGCTYIDDTVGSDLTLDDQSLKIGQLNIDCREGNYYEARLYKTDSMATSGLSYGYLGRMGNDTFGTRSASFFTQFLPYWPFDEDDDEFDEDNPFGYMPIFDSIVINLAPSGYYGDTTIVQKYEVYEIIDNSFLYNSVDSVFFPNFDIDPYLASEPVFTFSYPDYRNGIYVATSSITMETTDLSKDFIDRLWLTSLGDDYTYEFYEEYEEWLDVFKGLYIRPAGELEPITAGDPAALFACDVASGGFAIYGRTREESDPTLIKDTITQAYYFYLYNDDEVGNQTITKFEHNYEGSLINIDDVLTPEKSADQVPLTSTIRVEGMAGVVTQLTFTEEFFEQLDTILDAEEAETGEVYTSLFFNQAKMKIYMQEVDSYDYTTIDPYLVTPWMNVMPTSLGMYTKYSYYLVDENGEVFTDEIGEDSYYTTLTGIMDYIYAYESSYTLDYGGELNRSWGCYVMNVSAHVQTCWNYYLEAKEEAEENGTEINWDDVPDRVFYLAPVASDLNSFKYVSLQAGDGEVNSAPIYLELTYTMIR